MRILVQGFGPFGRFRKNPSELLVRALGEQPPAGLELHTEVIETQAGQVAEAVPALMASHRPDVWVGVGLAAGRPSLSVEAVAVNLGRWETADTTTGDGPGEAGVPGVPAEAEDTGQLRPPWPVSDTGPTAYLSTLPTAAILAAWREAGIPGYLSHTAGTYLCNMSFYLAAQAAERLGAGTLTGFLHVPLLPSQVDQPASEPSMPLSLQQAGLRLLLETCAATVAARAGGPGGDAAASHHPASRTGGSIPTGRTG
jgi:pyroglutamyl-peptidase